jgi:hypothetical protein
MQAAIRRVGARFICAMIAALASLPAGGCGNTHGNSDAGTSGSGGGSSGTSAGGIGGAGSGGGGGTSGGACSPACGEARDCCDRQCVNLQNDPRHCGRCGRACSAETFCSAGECVVPPCDSTCSGASHCCGTMCCGPTQLCCDPQGPIDMGPRCLDPDERGTCPMGCAPLCICADPNTPIATPLGERAIASLREGDLVYSIDRGALAVVPIARTHSTAVSHHSVMRIELRSGASLLISPGHPTADGRRFADLHAADLLDGVEITKAELVPYEHDATYDIMPASDTAA